MEKHTTQGQLPSTAHTTVLEILEKRARRWSNRYTAANIPSHDSTQTSFALMQEEQQAIENIHDSLLEVHGDPPPSKADGVCRLLYENLNGINNRMASNHKLNKAKQLIHDLEADMVAYNEHRLNLSNKRNINGFKKMFHRGETEIRTLAAHNTHEQEIAGAYQEGGTCLLAYGGIIDQFDRETSGRDESGLGRWVHMAFHGNNMTTRVICSYSPCYNRNLASGTSYSQQRRYLLTDKHDTTCPRTRFREDLVQQLVAWRNQGDRIILCMDANEHIYRKALGKILTDPAGLAMSEVVGDFTGEQLGATYFRGSKPIDAVWATTDLTVVGACVMPCGFGVGDHRLFVVDFLLQSMVGLSPTKIIRPAARRLNTRIPGVANRYTTELERMIVQHRLIERMGEAHDRTDNNDDMAIVMNNIDVEGAEYMRAAEKRCRKIRAGRIPFSPTTAKWIRRLQIYRSLLQYRAGRIKNRGNLERSAWRMGIVNPLHISEEELQARLRICLRKTESLKKSGWLERRRFLQSKCQEAQDREKFHLATQLLALIRREQEKAFWGGLRFALGKKKGRSVTSVQVETNTGEIVEYTGQEEVQEAIFTEVHKKRFFLAEQAPICNGWMRGEFGYLAHSPATEAILNDTYIYPPDFDEATMELCRACTQIRSAIPKDSVSPVIRHPEWSSRWIKAHEDTSSSESGLHFGHYKATARSPTIAHLHALKTSLVMKRGLVLERWGRGLSVMIEKLFGCNMVSKLRSILLMEADFNFANKIIFGSRMLGNARAHGLVPDEIFSEKNKTAVDGTLAKVLFYDLARQTRRPAGVASVDADNCFDRIAHAMASLCFQAFGVSSQTAQAMLQTIQEMKFFLRTAYGDSKTFAGSTIEFKTQGLCQGNGAAPAGWAIVSIVILNAHKGKGHTATFRCPITHREGVLSAILFVDDTDLLHINMWRREELEETHESLQASVTSWGNKLIATGGALKPSKCFYYLIDFVWREDGTWHYRELEEDELLQYQIRVPLGNGQSCQIEYLKPDEARKTLGCMTCPTGGNGDALRRMRTQAQGWVDDVATGKLPPRKIWLMLTRQFWPRVGYGIEVNTASLQELAEILRKPYYALLPLGGVMRSIHCSFRTLDSGFGGIGLPHPGIECTIAQVNLLLMHFGCDSSLGLMLQVSMELLVLELGLSSTEPFAASYEKFSDLVTHSWMKSLWEKCWTFNIQVTIKNISLDPPRLRDKWLMQAFIDEGYTGPELVALNRVRIHQQALFLSDVLLVSGGSVDSKYTQERLGGQVWSKLHFPTENPTPADFALWSNALYRVSPMGRAILRMREFNARGHKHWDWRLDVSSNRLLYQDDTNGTIRCFYPTERPNRWKDSHLEWTGPMEGHLCSVSWISDDVVAVQGTAANPPSPRVPTTFLDALHDANENWIWDDLVVTGDPGWIINSIREATCLAVTDGSYMADILPDVCSTAFTLECSAGRGSITGSFVERSAVACAY